MHSYIVPILPTILEDRLHVDKSETQAGASLVLSLHALVSMLTSPLIGYLADKISSQKKSLIASLGAEMIGTIVIMVSPSRARFVDLQCVVIKLLMKSLFPQYPCFFSDVDCKLLAETQHGSLGLLHLRRWWDGTRQGGLWAQCHPFLPRDCCSGR